jgi:LCP family protein required for cell wall assembly
MSGGRGRGPVIRRALGVLAVVVAIALVAVSLTAYLKYRSIWDSIERINVVGLGHRPPQRAPALNVLVIGSDSRAGANRRFGAGITGQRSDTIMIMHIAPDGRDVVVLSIPRDSVVPVLACPPEAGTAGQAAQPGQVEQINATFANGGPGCLWKTMEQTTRVRLDHFIEINFTGFEKIIDDIGGVSICLPFAVRDPQSKLYLSAGRHHVGGAEALAFWRARYIGEGSDLQRIRRDQYLMAALLQGIKHSDLGGSPGQVIRVVTDAARYMTTDSGLSLPAMIGIGQSLRHLHASAVQFIELPTAPYAANPDWVSWPPADARLFGEIARDQGLGPGPGHRTARAGGEHGSVVKMPAPVSGSPGNLARQYGGITGNANVCKDAGAFAGPRGGR